MSFAKGLWVEKYKPKVLEEVIGNDFLKEKFQDFIKKQECPCLLFVGKPGTGKTATAKLLGKAISKDVLYISASLSSGVDVIRNRVKHFCTTMGLGRGVKIVILDEADYITSTAQASLRNVIEMYYSTSRFIFTANYENRIIDPVRSRLQIMRFSSADKADIFKRCVQIVKNEKIKIPGEDKKEKKLKLLKIVNGCYPDIRKTINTLQSLIVGNILTEYKEEDKASVTRILELLKQKKVTEIRKLINAGDVLIEDLPRIIFDNLKDITDDKALQFALTVELNEFQVNDAFVLDKEINAVAMLTKIASMLK